MRRSPFHPHIKGSLDLVKLYSNSDLFLYSYARHAFSELLIICNIGKQDIVYLPGFICRDMLSPVYNWNNDWKVS